MTGSELLPVADQHLLTGLAEAGAVLLQARQHDHVALIHVRPAEPRDVAGAGVLALLRRSHGGHQNEGQNQGNDEKKSGHAICLHASRNGSPRLLSRFRANASPALDQESSPQKRKLEVRVDYFDATLPDCAAKSRSITARQPLERLARCFTMQAVIFGMFGISELQSRNASPVHICWASALKAKPEVEVTAENAAATATAKPALRTVFVKKAVIFGSHRRREGGARCLMDPPCTAPAMSTVTILTQR